MAVSASEIERLETSGNPRPRVHHADEFRLEAVEYLEKCKELDPKKTIKACAADLGTDDKTPDDWVLRFDKDGRPGNRGKSDEEGRISELEKRDRELELENALLKKPRPSTP